MAQLLNITLNQERKHSCFIKICSETIRMPVHRVDHWQKFKDLVLTLKPDTVYYLSEPHPLKKPPLGLRLTFYYKGNMYVFTDYAENNSLHKTGIPVTNPSDKIKAEIKEADIKNFLFNEFKKIKPISLPPFMY